MTDTVEAPPRPAVTGQRRGRWCWGTRLVMFAAGAWLAFVVLHLLLSGRLWLWQLPELLPPFVFAGVPAALLVLAPLARPAWWRVGLLALAAIALGAGQSGVNVATLWQRDSRPPADAIRVVSWNTRYWDQGDDQEAFYRYLKAQRADVYLLQEYVSRDTSREHDFRPIMIDESARLRAEFPGFHIAAAGELITLSRWPIVLRRPIDGSPWMSEEDGSAPPAGTDFLAYWTTKALRADVWTGRQTVSFYNLHTPAQINTTLSPLGSGFYQVLREQYSRRRASFAALATDFATNDQPAVVAGDFNATAAMGLRHLLPERLVDRTPTLGSLYPISWKDPGPTLWRLDWLFTTATVRVHRYALVDPDGLSDHHAQTAVVSLADGG